MSFWEYLGDRHQQLLTDACRNAGVVFACVAVATVLGVLIAVLAHRGERAGRLVTTTASTLLAVPSLAVIGLLIPVVGLGVPPTVIALTLFGLLPIVRHSVAGLRGVDPTARAVRVELAIAWPQILTGIRVATRMLMGIAAIAAYASGPGLGNEIFRGLESPAGENALNEVLAGTLGIVVLTLLFDAAYVVVGRLTIPRGVRV
ncbi:ABC transporter permease [Streptomyces sp. HUAS ZL42]|uniref:ABC transporter permease n=1 Tax=Streptomyces sp. HUAS ZL42 TaxID=3231715 RepID=UPI00345EFC3D